LGGLALLAAVATPAMALLPHPVLAAVVIAALAHAIDPAPIQRLWAMKRDYVVAICAAAAVLMLGIVNGMLVAIGLSVIDVLHRLSSPHIARLGRIGVHDYVDVARHDDAVMPPGIAIWRPAAPLFFANADRVLAAIAARSIGREPIHGIVVSLEESIDFDSTAMDALVEFDASMRAAGIAVRYARVHDLVRDLMDRSGAGDLHARSSFSVDDAVAALIGAGRRWPETADDARSRTRARPGEDRETAADADDGRLPRGPNASARTGACASSATAAPISVDISCPSCSGPAGIAM
jgi:MFS superfamily sulfate permease-like transporter